MSGTLGFAFAVGAVATVNPCGFALLPAYLARQLGGGPATRSARAAERALAVGGLATAGFLVVFASAGSAIALGAHALTGSFPWIGFVVGLLLVLLGLLALTGRRPLALLAVPHLQRRQRPGSLRDEFVFGIGYGLASLSCALPLFLATLGTALTGSLAASALSFAAYALGMGAVLTLLAVAAAFSQQGLARTLQRLLPYFERASAMLLLAAGLYVTDYWAVDLWRPGAGSAAAAPVGAGGRLATYLSTWLAGSRVKTTLLILAFCLLALTLWAVRRPIADRLRATARPRPVAPPRVSRRLAFLLGLTVLAGGAAASALALIAPGHAARPLGRGALLGYLDPPAPAPLFALRDQFGRRVQLERLDGRPVVIAFVYSHCREACPLTAGKIRTAQRALGPDAAKVAWLAISVDPRTDTASSVRAFSRAHGLLHSWRYLFRPRPAVLRTLKAYGIQPQLTEASAVKSPFLQHSAYISLLDRNGRRIESFTDTSLTSADLTHDLRVILGQHPAAPAASAAPAAPVSHARFTAQRPKLGSRAGVVTMTGTDLVSGRTVSLAADAGEPVVVNAWASWCAGCAAEAPTLAAFARAHPEAAVVGVDLEDSRGAATAFVRRFALPFPSIFDPDAVTAARLGVSGLPTTLFLDRRHHVVSRIVGEASRSRLEAGLRAASTISR